MSDHLSQESDCSSEMPGSTAGPEADGIGTFAEKDGALLRLIHELPPTSDAYSTSTPTKT